MVSLVKQLILLLGPLIHRLGTTHTTKLHPAAINSKQCPIQVSLSTFIQLLPTSTSVLNEHYVALIRSDDYASDSQANTVATAWWFCHLQASLIWTGLPLAKPDVSAFRSADLLVFLCNLTSTASTIARKLSRHLIY